MESFIGQIQIFGFSFAPKGWAICNGQLMSISQNQALFSLLGTTYGGDGRTTFALPDLRGRAVLNQGQGPGLSNYAIGQSSGTETVTLLSTQLPSHSHTTAYQGSSGPVTTNEGNGALLGESDIYTSGTANQTLNPAAIVVGNTGGNQAHDNMQPYLVLNFCILLYGIFPPRS